MADWLSKIWPILCQIVIQKLSQYYTPSAIVPICRCSLMCAYIHSLTCRAGPLKNELYGQLKANLVEMLLAIHDQTHLTEHED